MKEEEFKYILSLLDGLTEKIFEVFMQSYFKIQESKPYNVFTDEILEFLKLNFKTNPVTTSTLLKYFQNAPISNDENSKLIQNLYIEELENELCAKQSVDKLITLISIIKVDDNFKETFTQKILEHVCSDSLKQYRKQILMSLLPHDDPNLLKITSEYLQKSEAQTGFKLTPEYMLELCYLDKTHWLLLAAQVYKNQLHDLKTVTFKINNFTKQILIMVLLELTNSPETYDLNSLINQLTNIFYILETYTTTDENLQYYMTEVKRELLIIKFCLENNFKIMTSSIFSQVLSKSALGVVSELCRLSKVDRYKISRLLTSNNNMINELRNLSHKPKDNVDSPAVNWDIVTYNSYCAVTKIIDTVMASTDMLEETQDITMSLNEIKRLVTTMQPIKNSIELIENLFACLFLRYEYFSCEEHTQDSPCGAHSDCSYFYSKKQTKNIKKSRSSSAGFICNSLTTQAILNTLKLCLEAFEVNINSTTDNSITKRFKHIMKAVNHALWKIQLVSNLSPDPSPLQMKLCLDYVEVNESSEDDEQETDSKVSKKKMRSRRRHTNPNSNGDQQVMVSSTVSANDEGYSTIRGNSIDFISIMLAKPNSLVALALYHNDFPKANQIIEMFDLADGEIATEVTFTEQLRHLVAKIKNIILYKNDTRYPTEELSGLSMVSTEVMRLVEVFLASNRAPNSFDILELADRHPHLQLYSHQNAPFMNAVDILLSSGLNREISYGLINVVERKLAEVRNSIDVTAVKKTNYIRFVEDVASVTFEIFGESEKSFKFVENVCGLITDCRIPLKHKEFCKLNQLSKELKKSCEELANVVSFKGRDSPDVNLLQKYHQIYMSVVAASDKDICNLGEVCQSSSKKRTHYLRMCYMYCKTVSQLEQNNDRFGDQEPDASYFAVLERQLHDIFGDMINNKHISITSLEPICKKLNVNLIPKLILNFCPAIRLKNSREASEHNFNNILQAVFEFKNVEENLFIDVTADLAPLPRAPDQQSLTYIVLQNWVLAHLIKKIHTSEDSSSQTTDSRTKFINNYMGLARFDYLKALYNGNKCLASLHTTVYLDELFIFMLKLVESGQILKCLQVVDALSEHQLMSSPSLMNLRDLILFKIAINPNIKLNWKYSQYLKCPELKRDLILTHLSSWPMEGALEALEYLKFRLDRSEQDENLYENCNEWVVKIPLYDQISSIIGSNRWFEVYEKSQDRPEDIIDILIENQHLKLCLEWADLHNVSNSMKNLIIINLLRQCFEYPSQATPQLVKQLLSRLHVSQAIELVHEEINKVRYVETLQVCVDFITEHSSDWKAFENIKIGLQIMLEMEPNYRALFWDLIEKPLLMIEQLLMNAKLEVLSSILNKVAPNLKKDPSGDNLYYNIKSIESVVISRNAVDALLRFYAEKALDMKAPKRSYTPPPRSEDNLLQSIDSINIEAASKPFVMPELVPTKEQWVHDYSTDKCMLCHTSIFSMIIRRHHCRRCGRLVCHACSRNRMQVPTYPSEVKFRVCDDCYTQTMNKTNSRSEDNVMVSSNSGSITSGITCMDWNLSTNPSRNEAVRTEFSYEFIPNVTLCLSIMKMHSINLDYPRFLLDRSDEVEREMSCGGDARMLLRARRMLLLAAVELYSRTLHDKNVSGERSAASRAVAEAGAGHAARCLAHADSLATLVRNAAHHLLPHQAAHPSHIVRSLLEAEKWELALEIATKCGLSRNSVLAAWGKACLKAGCFKQARDKFGHCFRNAPLMFSDVIEDCEFGKEASEVAPPSFVHRRLQSLRCSERSSSVSSVQSEGRPRNNPPLLNEIVSMLEDMSYPVNQQLLHKADSIKTTNERLAAMNINRKKIQVTEPALNIMHTLASVRKIKLGDYSDFQTATVQPKQSLVQGLLRRTTSMIEPKTEHKKKLDPLFYKECIYYLSNYGSHAANIAFLTKHSDLTEVLKYCNDNLVDRETFTETVYMDCQKNDKVNDLFKSMSEMDSSLEMWGEYITHICRTLECSGRLEALYAVQVCSGQQARAAATCARLYSRPVPRGAQFAALDARHGHLAAALHHLQNCMPLSNKSTDSNTFHLHLDKATIDKHTSTISRQLELAKYLAACEQKSRLNERMIRDIIPVPIEDTKSKDVRPVTLFGSNTDRIRLVALVLVAGQTVEEGFNLAFKIITESKLDSMNIYTHVAKYLVEIDRFMDVKKLAKCIRVSRETAASLMSDQVLERGVSAVVAKCESRGQLYDEMAEVLIEDIHNISTKISCYLVCRILQSAYILAVSHDRTNDIRRVLQEAERSGKEDIRNACLKRLTNKTITSANC